MDSRSDAAMIGDGLACCGSSVFGVELCGPALHAGSAGRLCFLLRTAGGLAVATGWLPAAASGLDGSIGLLSDNVVYGISQSGGRASATGDAVYRSDTGWALTAGVATLGRDNPRGTAQFNAGAGLGGLWGGAWSWQASAVRYATLGSGPRRRPAYSELVASAGWRGRLQLLAAFSPDYPGGAPAGSPAGTTGAQPQRGNSVHIELTAHQPLGAGLALDAGLGHAAYGRIAFRDYRYGSVGLSWGRGPVQLYATRIFSNSASSTVAGPRAVLSALWSF